MKAENSPLLGSRPRAEALPSASATARRGRRRVLQTNASGGNLSLAGVSIWGVYGANLDARRATHRRPSSRADGASVARRLTRTALASRSFDGLPASSVGLEGRMERCRECRQDVGKRRRHGLLRQPGHVRDSFRRERRQGERTAPDPVPFQGVATGAADGYGRMAGNPPRRFFISGRAWQTVSPISTTRAAPVRPWSTSSAATRHFM